MAENKNTNKRYIELDPHANFISGVYIPKNSYADSSVMSGGYPVPGPGPGPGPGSSNLVDSAIAGTATAG